MLKPSLMMLTIALFCGVVQGAENDALIARMKSYKAQPEAWTAAQAGDDAKVMGEYRGEVAGKPWGAQIASLGLGTFRLIAYPGGLPGDGWKSPGPGGPTPRPRGLHSEGVGYLRDGRLHFAIRPLDAGQNEWVWRDGMVHIYDKKPLVLRREPGKEGDRGPQGTYTDPAFKGGLHSRPLEMHISACGSGFRAVVTHRDAPPASYAEAGPEWGIVLYGERQGDVVPFDIGDGQYTARWTASGLEINEGKKVAGKLARIDRVSPNAGAKPPQGAVVLFDGTDMNSWQMGPHSNEVAFERAKKIFAEEKLLSPGLVSKQTFGDCHIHFDMLLASGPGKTRGSGLKPHNRYQIVILESFASLWGVTSFDCQMMSLLKLGSDKSPTPKHGNAHWPDENVSLPPMTWQGVDVDLTAAKFVDGKKTANAILSVRFNGHVLYDKLELTNVGHSAPKEGPEPGPIQFMNGHGVRFRNVWVLPKEGSR
jgi:hypothetical protein